MKKLILLFVFLFACSSQFYLRQAYKKGIVISKSDTIFKTDTLKIIGYKTDFVFKIDTFIKKNDTIILYKDKIKLKYLFSKYDSLIYIYVKCPDTIAVNKKEIIRNDILIQKNKSIFAKIWIWVKGNFIVLIIALCCFAVYKILKIFGIKLPF